MFSVVQSMFAQSRYELRAISQATVLSVVTRRGVKRLINKMAPLPPILHKNRLIRNLHVYERIFYKQVGSHGLWRMSGTAIYRIACK